MARSIERGYNIGIFAPIRVEWWLAHAHQRFHRTNHYSAPGAGLVRRGAAHDRLHCDSRHIVAP